MLDQLMNAAEIGIRQNGYNAISFRELAEELGIKSASVHYYFRKKEDLGIALMRRYSERFFAALEENSKDKTEPRAKFEAFCEVYREALAESDAICLGGMLGAETCSLPDSLSGEVARFFQDNIDWLTAALPEDWDAITRKTRATQTVATLQGLMMVVSNMNDKALFDNAVASLVSDMFARSA